MIPTLLAAANTANAANTQSRFVIPTLSKFPAQTDLMSWCQDMGIGTCILLILVGAVYLMYGWSIFKILITLNSALIGAYVGVLLGARAGGYLLPGGLLGAAIASVVAWPMMKWAVAVIGGLCGAFVGASLWQTCGQDPAFAWAGAMTGLVGFGMLSFILFRGSIITYTSIQGAGMLIVGLLGLALKWPELAPAVARSMATQPLVLPVAIVVPAMLGLIYQQTHSAPLGGAPAGGPPQKR